MLKPARLINRVLAPAEILAAARELSAGIEVSELSRLLRDVIATEMVAAREEITASIADAISELLRTTAFMGEEAEEEEEEEEETTWAEWFEEARHWRAIEREIHGTNLVPLSLREGKGLSLNELREITKISQSAVEFA